GHEATPIDWVFPRAIWQLIARIAKNRPAFRTLFFISWFWFLGATFLSLLPAFAKEVLGADEGVLTVLLAAFSVGVAIGALASEKLAGGRDPICVPPYGALGMGIMAIELWLATPASPPPDLLDRAAFFADPAGWRILADFVLIAAFAGAYVTPLNAILQREAEEDARGQYIAASNVIDASFIVLSAAVVGVLVALGLRADGVLAVLTLSGLPMALIVARFAPQTHLGRAALTVWPRHPNPDFPPGTP
ncbi:MAG: MFS transporter, partial [Pseudomonadota bacterium]